MEYEVFVAFTLTGTNLDPDQVTALTRVVPSKTWRVGELINPRAILRYKHNGWKLESGISGDLDSQANAVLVRLRPAWTQFRQLSERYYAELECTVYIHGAARPPIHFDPDLVRHLAELNAGIDVDLYVLPRKRRGAAQ